MNFLPVQQISDRDGKALVRLPDNSEILTGIAASRLPNDGQVTFGIRPESVRVSANGAVTGKADVVERLGERTLAYVRLSDNSVVIAEDEGQSRLNVGDQVKLDFDGASGHLFDARDVAYSAG